MERRIYFIVTNLFSTTKVKCTEALRTLTIGRLTLKFDRVTWPFLKIKLHHEACRHERKYE